MHVCRLAARLYAKETPAIHARIDRRVPDRRQTDTTPRQIHVGTTRQIDVGETQATHTYHTPPMHTHLPTALILDTSESGVRASGLDYSGLDYKTKACIRERR